MIRVKSIFDRVEQDDGVRIWVEPICLVRNLQEWCEVDYVLPQLGPPLPLWHEVREHPERYDYFAAQYQAYLEQQPGRSALAQLAVWASTRPLTLLHEGDDPCCNTAMALADFLGAWHEHKDR